MSIAQINNPKAAPICITIYLTPEKEFQISSWARADINSTVTCRDWESMIKAHIDQFSEAWKELAKL